jgi:hypothetical protein
MDVNSSLSEIKIPIIIPTEFLNIPHRPLPTQVCEDITDRGYPPDSPDGFELIVRNGDCQDADGGRKVKLGALSVVECARLTCKNAWNEGRDSKKWTHFQYVTTKDGELEKRCQLMMTTQNNRCSNTTQAPGTHLYKVRDTDCDRIGCARGERLQLQIRNITANNSTGLDREIQIAEEMDARVVKGEGISGYNEP